MESASPVAAARAFGPPRVRRSARRAALLRVATVLVAAAVLIGTFALYLRPSAMLDFGQLMILCGMR
jgi:hypothetical protein